MIQQLLPFLALSPNDDIKRIQLDIRALNALKRANIHSIGELLELLEKDSLQRIKGIGNDSEAKIKAKLADIHLSSIQNNESSIASNSNTRIQAKSHDDETQKYTALLREAVDKEIALVNRQIKAHLLHEQVQIAGKPLAAWIAASEIKPELTYRIFSVLFANSVNICDDLSSILDDFSSNYISVFIDRYGQTSQTLQDIGQKLDITRERARQISAKTSERILDKLLSPVTLQEFDGLTCADIHLIRIQSALLIANDMGFQISYQAWENHIVSSGLVGSWPDDFKHSIDAVESMIALCNLLAEHNISVVKLPSNLKLAIELNRAGTPHLTATILHIGLLTK